MHDHPHARAALIFLVFAALVLSIGCSSGNTRHKTASTTVVSGDLHFDFLNVGQGDSCLASWSENGTKQFGVIDAGPPESSKHVLEELKAQGCTRVRVLIFTHAHLDHYGGGVSILNAYPVDEIWQPSTANSTATAWATLETTAREKGTRIVGVSAGTRARWGNASVDILNPGNQTGSTTNNSSIVLLVTEGRSDLLLTGDAEIAAEEQMANDVLPHVELMKASHHGSNNGADARFINIVSPDISIISVGPNSYGHPNQDAVSVLSGKGDVLRTDQQGDISVDLEQGDIKVKTDNGFSATVTSK